MPTLSPQTTPYYGGGQVINPANVKKTVGAPSTKLTQDLLGTFAVDNAASNIYALVSKSGGVDTWSLIGSSTGSLQSIITQSGTATATAGALTINGATNQITTSASGSTITLSLSGTLLTPGDLEVGSGNLIITLGDLNIQQTGSKINISTGTNASVGTSAAMSGTPGTVTVATTAVSSGSTIFYNRKTAGGTLGEVSITSQTASTGFILTSDANETSTFNWWIIN